MVVSMTREDIIRMALEAEVLSKYESPTGFCAEAAVKFAALVASAEREACIVDIQWHIPRSGRHTPEYQMAMRMIERIRARGQA
jgi:cobalamin biosynthesis protein CbiD